MKVHEILRKLRRDNDFTQQNIADEIGVDITTYNRYEKDASTIQVDVLEKVAKFYGLTLSQLLSYNEADLAMLREPDMEFERVHKVQVIIELDGQASTVDYWIKRIKKLNAAVA